MTSTNVDAEGFSGNPMDGGGPRARVYRTRDLIELWTCAQRGSLHRALRGLPGGAAGVDEAAAAARYVEATPGYGAAHPVMVRRYLEHEGGERPFLWKFLTLQGRPTSFWATWGMACRYLGWGDEVAAMDPQEGCWHVLRTFRAALDRRNAEEPFRLPRCLLGAEPPDEGEELQALAEEMGARQAPAYPGDRF